MTPAITIGVASNAGSLDLRGSGETGSPVVNFQACFKAPTLRRSICLSDEYFDPPGSPPYTGQSFPPPASSAPKAAIARKQRDNTRSCILPVWTERRSGRNRHERASYVFN